MDTQAYIETGILELYATGTLSAVEMEQVESLCKAHPDIRKELTAIQTALESYALLNATNPGNDVKEKIYAAIDFNEERTHNATLRVEKVYKRPTNWLMAASLIFGLLSGALSVYFYAKHADSQSEIAVLQKNIRDLSDKNATVLAQLEVQKASYASVVNPNNKLVVLNPLPLSPTAKALVYYDSVSKTSYISMAGLPKPSGNRQYQLWAIVGGKPVDMGVLPLNDSNTLIKTPFISQPAAFAITLEPVGGSVSPTLDQMVSMGAVSY